MTYFGIDILLRSSPAWKTARLALVTNDAATTGTGKKSRLALTENGFNLQRLLSPEHGLSTAGADGIAQADGTDPLTGLPVISLYGHKLKPAAEDLAGIDYVLFDIPDAGCRFYTYLWTLTYVMEACAACNIPMVLLDRPNPLSGALGKTEGPALDEQHCSSFIGRWNIPVRHSCTFAELALYFAANYVKDVPLEIIPLKEWNRQQTVDESGWLFVPTSPAIRTTTTLALYPALCFLEAITVNEGRGTELDFNCCGAPWINSTELFNAFKQLSPPGITAEPFRYTPGWGLYAGEICEGLRFTVTDAAAFKPVFTGLQLLQLIYRLYPEHCSARLYKTAANPEGMGHLDRLTGVYHAWEQLKNGTLAAEAANTDNWSARIRPYLLY